MQYNKKQGRVERRETRRRVLSGYSRASALAPFGIRNYRFQWPSDLLTSWAFEVENLVLGWYIMVETGSVLLLTVLASLNYVGTLIAPVFGMIGDRIGHRDLLAAMRFAYTVLSSTIMMLALTGHLAPLNVMIIVAIMGLIRPSDLGVRGALLADIMPAERLVGAISVSRTTQDSARIAGALSGTGLFAVLGIGFAYVAIACLYLTAAVLMLCLTRPAKPHGMADHPADDLPGSSAVARPEGGHCLCLERSGNARGALRGVSWPISPHFRFTNGLLPYVAREIFHTDQAGLGYLSASFAFGSLIGSITLSLTGGVRIARLLIGATLAWYTHAAGVRGDQDHAGGDAVPGACRHRAEPFDDFGSRDPDAYGERAPPRPRDGRADDGDLRPAAGAARCRQPDRPHRLFRDGHALCSIRIAVHDGDCAALARRSVAGPRAGQRAIGGYAC